MRASHTTRSLKNITWDSKTSTRPHKDVDTCAPGGPAGPVPPLSPGVPGSPCPPVGPGAPGSPGKPYKHTLFCPSSVHNLQEDRHCHLVLGDHDHHLDHLFLQDLILLDYHGFLVVQTDQVAQLFQLHLEVLQYLVLLVVQLGQGTQFGHGVPNTHTHTHIHK